MTVLGDGGQAPVSLPRARAGVSGTAALDAGEGQTDGAGERGRGVGRRAASRT